jgi:hypothetical protein
VGYVVAGIVLQEVSDLVPEFCCYGVVDFFVIA